MLLYFKKMKNCRTFDISNEMSEYVTLVQLMDRLGIISHNASIAGVWIYDTNYINHFL